MSDVFENIYYDLKTEYEYIDEFQSLSIIKNKIEKINENKRTLEDCDSLYYSKIRLAEISIILHFMFNYNLGVYDEGGVLHEKI